MNIVACAEKTLRGAKIIFESSLRVPFMERIEGYHYYDVRHDDECIGIACSVEPFVFVNHLGTIATDKPLPLDNLNCLDLTEDEAAMLF